MWAGADERPLWRRSLGAPVRALATTVGEVLALDGNGRLHRFDDMAGSPPGRRRWAPSMPWRWRVMG